MAQARRGSQTPTRSVVLPYTVTKRQEAVDIYYSTGRTAQSLKIILRHSMRARYDAISGSFGDLGKKGGVML